ncbi:MAG: TIGR00730 family Rossman fold protein [Chthoniobacteraceae bacterium]
MRRVCVYAGSSPGARPEFAAAARELGTLLAARRIGVVYGGGNVGLMGALADAALAAGGEVIGVIPHALAAKELGHGGVTQLHAVETMHERKARMAAESDAFIALPGGIGTLEELFESLTWLQLGLHAKPVGLLNIAGYYDHLLAFLETMEAERFIRPEHRAMLLVENDPARLLTRLLAFTPPEVGKWLDRFASENTLPK